eukprot:568701-Prymnesium_polylepis.1
MAVAVSPNGEMLFITDCGNHKVRMIATASATVSVLAGSGTKAVTDGTRGGASFNNPLGVAITSDGSAVYVTDFGGHTVRRIEISSGVVTTVAGKANTQGFADGSGTNVRFENPSQLVISPDNTQLFVTDESNNRVRKIALSAQAGGAAAVTTLA